MNLNDFSKTYGGVFSLMLTPYNDDYSIDYSIYPDYCKWMAEQGTHHFFVNSGSSEMMHLNLNERVRLAQLCVENKTDDVTVWSSANLEPTWEGQLDEIERIEATGVDGLIFVTKGYGNDDERMVKYITDLAAHTKLPVLLYEFPGFPNNKISGAAYGRLVKDGIVHGIKDTTCLISGGEFNIAQKLSVQGSSCVMNANIPYLYDSYEMGARGVVATPSTCGTKLLRKMWDAWCAGDKEAAKIWHAAVCSLSDVLDCGFNSSAKYIVSLLSDIPMKEYSRANKNPLSPQAKRNLEVWVEDANRRGLFD